MNNNQILNPQKTIADKLLGHLSRISSKGRTFLPQIDGLRFIAIIWVILFHVSGYCSNKFYNIVSHNNSEGFFGAFIKSGHYGVQLFFAISGFILAMPFASYHLNSTAQKPKLGQYYVRRLTRLEPPYIIHLIIAYALAVLVIPVGDRSLLSSFLLSLTYSNQLIMQQTPGINVVLWSLEIEVQFYCLAPILTLFFGIRNKNIRRAVWAFLMLLFSLLTIWGYRENIFRVSNTILGNLQYFTAGFFILDLYLTDWQKPVMPAKRFVYDLISLVSLVIIVYMGKIGDWKYILLPWIILTMYSGAFNGKLFVSFLCNRWIVTIGGMCYTIYMYHYLMISFIGKITARLITGNLWLDIVIQFILMCAIILPCSAVLFFLFERPFMKRDWYLDLWGTIKKTKLVAKYHFRKVISIGKSRNEQRSI